MTLDDAVAELRRRARIVQAPGGLWHLRTPGAETTLCDQAAGDWPTVIGWERRSGITCGLCLIAAGVIPARSSSRRG